MRSAFRCRLLCLLALTIMPSPPARAAPFIAFGDGETLTYRVSWGIFFHAGDIVIAARKEKDAAGADVIRITTDTATRGFIRSFYTYNSRAEAIIDLKTGRVVFMREKGSDGTHHTDTETAFDYAGKIAHFVDHYRPGRSRDVAIPDGDPIDLISALVQTRDWNLRPGQKKNVLVNFKDEFFPIAILATRLEEVYTPLDTYQTLMLVPRMEQNPKGIFKRGGEFKVWISQNGHRLPVKMQLKLPFGSAVLSLAKYQPPVAPAPGGHAAREAPSSPLAAGP